MIRTASPPRPVGRTIGLLLLVGPLAPAAGEPSGAAFLKIPSSARSFALGRSQAVSSLGAEALGANPANIGATPRRYEFLSSYASLMDETSYGHMAAVFAPPLGGLGALEGIGLSATRLQVGGLGAADAAGNRVGGSFGASDMMVAVGGAARVTGSLSLGLTAKMLQSEIGGYRSGASLLGDVGLRYTRTAFSRPLAFGLSVNNIGQGVRFMEQRDPPPTSVEAGLAVPFGPVLGMLHLRRLVREQETELGTGLEIGVGPVAVRAGFRADKASAPNLAARNQRGPGAFLQGLSGGVGLRLGGTRIDYALSQQGVEYGTTQRVSLALQWGAKEATRAPKPWRHGTERRDWYLMNLEWPPNDGSRKE